MDQDNRFQHQHQQSYGQSYGYDQYGQESMRRNGIVGKILGRRLASKLRSPLVATSVLLLAGAAFAGVIVMSYPKEQDEASVPVVHADATPFKVEPSDAGGADVPFRDNTIFATMTGEGNQAREEAPVENLLEEEEPVSDRMAAFASEAETMMDRAEAETSDVAETASERPRAEDRAAVAAEAEVPRPVEIKKIVQTVEKIPPKVNPAVVAQQDRPQIIHAPGASPETLDFVRSVLDQKDGKAVSDRVAAVEPAAGGAHTAAAAIEPGSYFVQLASVTSKAGAGTEWSKLQRTFSEQLQNAAYRVQEADLGERGVYYRVQAGPMSKDSAHSICDAIKARKPGGCLVVK